MVKAIEFDDSIDVVELTKAISFVSEDVNNVYYEKNTIILEVNDGADVELLLHNIEEISTKYKKINKQYLMEKFDYRKENAHYSRNIMNDETLFSNFGDGMFGLNGLALFLYKYFEKKFTDISHNIGAISKQYPVLLPLDSYIKTGYLSRSPQYAMFCNSINENFHDLEQAGKCYNEGNLDKILQSPYLALSPSACFHTYVEFMNKTLTKKSIFAFTQSVFRNEGRLNYGETGRLRDYHVHEIVFFGDEKYVCDSRDIVINKVKNLLRECKLTGVLQTASDPFVLPKMQKYKKIQLLEKSKVELRLNVFDDNDIAVASFNLHGTAFTHPFNIHISECENPVTGCVGFGIERWVIAFLYQHGNNPDEWPEDVKTAYYEIEGRE